MRFVIDGETGLRKAIRETSSPESEKLNNLNLVGHFAGNVRRWRNGRILVRLSAIAGGLREAARSDQRVSVSTHLEGVALTLADGFPVSLSHTL